MAQLKDIIGAVLRDLSEAQDTAVRYSSALSQEYRLDPVLKQFAVPRADLGEVDIDLKFALKSVTPAPNRPERVVADAATTFQSFAADAATSATKAVTSLLGAPPSDGNGSGPQFSAQDATERGQLGAAVSSSTVVDYLKQRISEALFAKRDELVRKDGSVDARGVQAIAASVIHDIILAHPDLAPLFARSPELKAQAASAIAAGVPKGPQLARPLQAFAAEGEALRSDYQLEIVDDPAVLRDLPDSAYSHVRMKVNMHSFRWVAGAKTDGNDDLIPVT
jgi:hypothetical protein